MNSIWCLFFTSRDWFVSCIISLPARWSWSNESLQQWLYLLNSHLFQSQRSPSNSVSQYTRACIRFVLCNTAFRKILDRWTPHNASCIITKPSKCSSVPDRWCQKWHLNRQHASFWKAVDESICVRAYFIPHSGTSVMIDSSQHFVSFSEWFHIVPQHRL